MSQDPGVVALGQAIAGASGAGFGLFVSYPLLNASMRLQVDRALAKRGTLSALVAVLRDQGLVNGWFAGVSSALVATIALQFVFGWARKYLTVRWLRIKKELRKKKNRKAAGDNGEGPETEDGEEVKEKLSMSENLIIGFLAGCLGITATQPLWVVNTRMAVMRKSNTRKNFLQVLVESALSDPLSLYAGWTFSIILCINPSIQFMVYDKFQEAWKAHFGDSKSSLRNFMFGAGAKAVATIATYPLSTIKSRMQAGKPAARAPVPAPASMPSPAVQKSIVKQIASLYAGFGVKLSHSVLQSAVQFALQEHIEEASVRLSSVILGRK
eukprot:NODE_2355_length_1222_cov_31.832907_g2149_i0.p1 GENE.NODE_2355_length_1222_cov_31.832907_g2149_i0~~NODE_2355_length_1222_cov_31.832907_g2149_i0.p1  ORF type:complete len:364 (+),score=85.82 NODE_2355_length_1222_cov_31.832907_g2149_i0:116-1093(+)